MSRHSKHPKPYIPKNLRTPATLLVTANADTPANVLTPATPCSPPLLGSPIPHAPPSAASAAPVTSVLAPTSGVLNPPTGVLTSTAPIHHGPLTLIALRTEALAKLLAFAGELTQPQYSPESHLEALGHITRLPFIRIPQSPTCPSTRADGDHTGLPAGNPVAHIAAAQAFNQALMNAKYTASHTLFGIGQIETPAAETAPPQHLDRKLITLRIKALVTICRMPITQLAPQQFSEQFGQHLAPRPAKDAAATLSPAPTQPASPASKISAVAQPATPGIFATLHSSLPASAISGGTNVASPIAAVPSVAHRSEAQSTNTSPDDSILHSTAMPA